MVSSDSSGGRYRHYPAVIPGIHVAVPHMPKSPNILITGPLGHIGSHLIRHLDRSVFSGTVTLLDNLESRRFASLHALPRKARFRFLEDDVLTADFASLLRDVG